MAATRAGEGTQEGDFAEHGGTAVQVADEEAQRADAAPHAPGRLPPLDNAPKVKDGKDHVGDATDVGHPLAALAFPDGAPQATQSAVDGTTPSTAAPSMSELAGSDSHTKGEVEGGQRRWTAVRTVLHEKGVDALRSRRGDTLRGAARRTLYLSVVLAVYIIWGGVSQPAGAPADAHT